MDNHQGWVQVILDHDLQGVITTGWSRYAHSRCQVEPLAVRFDCKESVTHVRERISSQVIDVTNSQQWDDTLKPLDVRIYQIQPRD